MSFRIPDQNPVFLNASGQICAGGSLSFFTNNTTTPTVTYADSALSVSNGTSVTLGTDGRSPVELWTGATIRMVLKDHNGTTIWTRDNVQSGSGLPALIVNGFIYSPDGITLLSATIRQLTDPTGKAGQYMRTSDGIAWDWDVLDLSAGAFASMAGWLCKNMREVAQSVTASTATTDIDCSLGGVVLLAHNVDTTLTFSNQPAAGQACVMTIVRTKDASATSRALTLPSGKKNAGGVAPTLTQTTGAVDIFSVLLVAGTVNYWSGTSAYT